MLQIKQFEVACQNPQRQLQRLKSCARNYFTDSKDKIIVDNFIKLLGKSTLITCVCVIYKIFNIFLN